MRFSNDWNSEKWKRNLFSWLTRSKIGLRFGKGLPVSWYQQHQVCAVDAIENAAAAALGGDAKAPFDAKVKKGRVYVRAVGSRGRYKDIGEAEHFRVFADRCARK